MTTHKFKSDYKLHVHFQIFRLIYITICSWSDMIYLVQKNNYRSTPCIVVRLMRKCKINQHLDGDLLHAYKRSQSLCLTLFLPKPLRWGMKKENRKYIIILYTSSTWKWRQGHNKFKDDMKRNSLYLSWCLLTVKYFIDCTDNSVLRVIPVPNYH